MSTFIRRRVTLAASVAVVTLLAACDPQKSPTRPSVRDDPELAGYINSADNLARTFASWLRDAEVRTAVFQAIRYSELKENKLSWRAFMSGPAASLLARGPDVARAASSSPSTSILGLLGDLEIYFPVHAHREAWTGDENLLVAVYLGPAQIRDGWVAYDLKGNAVPLSLDHPPATPILMIHRPEGFKRIADGPFMLPCAPEDCPPVPPPPPPPPPPPSPNRVALAGRPFGVARSGTIAYITQLDANRVARFNLQSNTFTASITTGATPAGVVFNPMGSKAYVTHLGAQTVGIIDVASSTQTGTIAVQGNPLPVAISLDGNTLFVTTDINKLFKINLTNNTVVGSLDLPALSHHLLLHPNGNLLYVATRDGGSVLEVAWQTMTVARTFTLGGRTQGMAISPDQSELYVANETSNMLHVITLSSGATMNISLEGGAHDLALNASGTKIFVGLVFDGRVQILDRETRATLVNANIGGTPRRFGAVWDGRMLLANEAGSLDIFGANGSLPPPPPPQPPPPLPRGLYMVGWYIGLTYEPWWDSDPEYEITAFIGEGLEEPTLGSVWGCAAGNYPSSSPRDWYYNEEGEYHNAAEQGRQGITILDTPQWDAYWTGFSGHPRRIWLTENDDDSCASWHFPSVGNPDPFGNDDDPIEDFLTPFVTENPWTRIASGAQDGYAIDFKAVH